MEQKWQTKLEMNGRDEQKSCIFGSKVGIEADYTGRQPWIPVNNKMAAGRFEHRIRSVGALASGLLPVGLIYYFFFYFD